MRYELCYWPSIQGRGEFIRLALEDAGVDYVDVARRPGGLARLKTGSEYVFAPPWLKAGSLVISQTANILHYLGPRLGLAPQGRTIKAEAGRLRVHQLQLTIADWLSEVHDTHHPIASHLYYEDQKPEAKRRAAEFRRHRLPKYLGFFEPLAKPRGPVTYADLSLFQMIEGLRYAFPRTMRRLERRHPRLVALHDRVAARPRLAAYLASPRRIPFNQSGIFRHYPELDG